MSSEKAVLHLAYIFQARVGFCVAGRGDAASTGFRGRRERSDPAAAERAPGLGPVPRWAAAVVVGAAALASLSACATAQSYGPPALSADQSVRVAEICRTVIRVQPQEEQYAGCIGSLAGSLDNVGRAAAMQRSHDECVAKGFAPATAQLAECLVSAVDPRPVSTPAVSSRSYFYASAAEVRRREELSCAQLGLEPEGGAFASCVADLAAALFAADTPQN